MNSLIFSIVESQLVAGQVQTLNLMAKNTSPKMLKNVSARLHAEGNWRCESINEVTFPLIAPGQSALQPLTVSAEEPGEYSLRLKQVRALCDGEGIRLSEQTILVTFGLPETFDPAEKLTLQVSLSPGKVHEWSQIKWRLQNLAGWSLDTVGLRWQGKGLQVESDEVVLNGVGAGTIRTGDLRVQPLEAGACELRCVITAEACGIYGVSRVFEFELPAHAQHSASGASTVTFNGDVVMTSSGNVIGGGVVSGNDFSRHSQVTHHNPVDIQQTVGDGGVGLFRTPLAAGTPEPLAAVPVGVCPRCKKKNLPESHFCVDCGMKLPN